MKNPLGELEKNISNLTKSQKLVANYILKNPVKSAFLTISEISDNAGVSTNSTVRLVNEIGYSGYQNFKDDLQNIIKNKLSPTNKLENSFQKFGNNNLLDKTFENSIYLLEYTYKMIDKEKIMKIIDKIKKANKIFITGIKSGYPVAYYLYHGLNRAKGNCEIITEESLPEEKILEFTEQDLLFVISYPRYIESPINIAKQAQIIGTSVIAISDNYSSPISKYSDIIIPVEITSTSFHNSIISGIFMVDIILTAFSFDNPKEVINRLKKIENLYSDWDLLSEGNVVKTSREKLEVLTNE